MVKDDTIVGEGTGEEDEDPEAFEESRATITLSAGEKAELTIPCPFEPERVLVDPDALVLQLGRERALHRF